MIRPFVFLLLCLGLALPPVPHFDEPAGEMAFRAQLLADFCGSAPSELPGKGPGCPACILHSGAPLPGPVSWLEPLQTSLGPSLESDNPPSRPLRQPSAFLPPSRGPPPILS